MYPRADRELPRCHCGTVREGAHERNWVRKAVEKHIGISRMAEGVPTVPTVGAGVSAARTSGNGRGVYHSTE